MHGFDSGELTHAIETEADYEAAYQRAMQALEGIVLPDHPKERHQARRFRAHLTMQFDTARRKRIIEAG